MKNILVLGATGFIGSHTLDYLSGITNINVIAACRSTSKLSPRFSGEVREGDVRNEEYLNNLFTNIDVVINAMAWTSLWGHTQESNELFLEPTLKIIDEFLASDASRFVNISTTSAASPDHSIDSKSEGIPRKFWPHLSNVIKIENYLHKLASDHKKIVNLRLGLFTGENFGIGLLPILLPRLNTHLVPWVQGGNTAMPLGDGRDYGQAMGLAAITDGLDNYTSINVVGKETPSVREVITFLHEEFNYPKPHFGVSFKLAYAFAWLMEKLDPISPWEPLIVRSIVHLLEETHVDNSLANELLAYEPKYHWKDSVKLQIEEMDKTLSAPMSMAKPVI